MKPIQLHAPSRAFHHGNLTGYVIGLGVSLVLTLASFGTVMSGLVPHGAAMVLLVLLCVAQLLAQLVFFLHLGTAPDQRANTGIFACTALLIAIIVAGSLWVTHNANANMMPTHMSVERARTKG
jgi:cytochrome o ubiquinol oxidase operon protein cyoD